MTPLSQRSLVLLSSALLRIIVFLFFFFFNDTATTEIYTLSLHDALPILVTVETETTVLSEEIEEPEPTPSPIPDEDTLEEDRKSTRLNSSHVRISYAVFCLKKKKKNKQHIKYLP